MTLLYFLFLVGFLILIFEGLQSAGNRTEDSQSGAGYTTDGPNVYLSELNYKGKTLLCATTSGNGVGITYNWEAYNREVD